MTTVRIENAAYLVTVNDADDILTTATITITDGTITEITSATGGGSGAAEPAARRRPGAEPEPSLRPGSGGDPRGAAEPEAAARQPDAEREPSLRPLAGSGGSDRVRAAGEGADGLRPHEGSRGADPTAEPDHRHPTKK